MRTDRSGSPAMARYRGRRRRRRGFVAPARWRMRRRWRGIAGPRASSTAGPKTRMTARGWGIAGPRPREMARPRAMTTMATDRIGSSERRGWKYGKPISGRWTATTIDGRTTNGLYSRMADWSGEREVNPPRGWLACDGRLQILFSKLTERWTAQNDGRQTDGEARRYHRRTYESPIHSF